VITIHQRHRQTDGQTDRRTDGRTSSDPMTATLLKHVAVKNTRPKQFDKQTVQYQQPASFSHFRSMFGVAVPILCRKLHRRRGSDETLPCDWVGRSRQLVQSHLPQVLNRLHWLPVRQRITFMAGLAVTDVIQVSGAVLPARWCRYPWTPVYYSTMITGVLL